MSKIGLQIAKLFGRNLPGFSSKTEAEAELFAERDKRLDLIAKLSASSETFSPDLTPESLKGMERWYFELVETDGFSTLGTDRSEVERLMATYFGAVAVRNCPKAEWIVEEYPFEPGRYEIGVRRGNLTSMTGGYTDHYKYLGNKRRQKIYREYQQYFGS